MPRVFITGGATADGAWSGGWWPGFGRRTRRPSPASCVGTVPSHVVAIRVGARPAVGAMIVARNGGDGYVVKRVRRVGRQYLELESFNPAYAPFQLAREPSAVVGVVTHVLRDE